jgi:prepilin-type N-terminal cleavage/methylation domain-containing protein
MARPTPSSEIGKLRAVASSRDVSSHAFSLTELLAVVVIMAIILSVLGVSLSRSSGPATRTAAAQVASGLSLTRQLAISRNTEARFIIANSTNSGFPAEPYRYWAVVYSNKDAPTRGIWVMEKDWEQLPQGTVFLNLAGNAYSTIQWDPIGAQQGRPYRIGSQIALNGAGGTDREWQYFASFGNMQISYPDSPDRSAFSASGMPYVAFKPDGRADASLSLGPGRALGLRVAEGSVTPDNQMILRSTNNAFYVETDPAFGKVRVRGREDYR